MGEEKILEKIGLSALSFIKDLEIHLLLSDAADTMEHGRARTIIFGIGGIGKSTLGKLIARAGVNMNLRDYNKSESIENMKAQGRLWHRVHILPGQKSERRQRAHDNLPFNFLNADRLLFVHCVAYGYATPEKGHDPLKEFRSFKRYAAERRKAEIEWLEYMSDTIVSATAETTIVTMLLKRDLWWPLRDEVRSWYNGSPYADALSDIVGQRAGKPAFTAMKEACLIEEPLRTSSKRLLCDHKYDLSGSENDEHNARVLADLILRSDGTYQHLEKLREYRYRDAPRKNRWSQRVRRLINFLDGT